MSATTLPASREWLRTLCDPYRPTLAAPFTMEIDGVVHTIATNGYTLVAIAGAYADAAPAEIRESVGHVLALRPKATPVSFSLAALREFVGITGPVAPPCATCADKGVQRCPDCDGEGGDECECHCGHEHERECRRCAGTGEVPCPSCRRGRSETKRVAIFGVQFDASVVARAIRHLPGDTATWAQDEPDRMAFLCGEGWMAALMPVRYEPTADIPTFPARQERAA